MTPGPRPALGLALPAIAGALLMLVQPAGAQQDAPKAEGMERAQKAADAVFHWIKLHADKPAPRPQPAPAPAPKKSAPVAATPRPTPVAVATPAATASTAAAPPPVIAARPEPEPEPDREPVVLAAAAPTPAPAAPMAAAAQAMEPPAAAPEQAEESLQLLSKVDPAMPRQLQQTSFRNGYAQVQFTVAPDGSVRQAAVIKASHSRLGTAAVEAVRQWRFAPLRKAREAAVEIAFSNEGD